ncbi:hypothetical protein HYN48_13715 [Flavobacterium magnum]|uniref:Lipoprotein n=1 Tax=Flavobacterium magnum TaxID=2162713 RepID=A0A2S0RHC4_9FLAO|nr:hypothetical protein [Flavobacterium magnum]AWA31056.1 hypothetical protein HYN48_13715 [Flavobacterium magnum]
MNAIKSLSIILLFTACTKSTPKIAESTAFFNFDEVIHYKLDNNVETEAISRARNEDPNVPKIFRIFWSFSNYPARLNDSAFFKDLDKMYINEGKISADKLPEISDIFSERKVESITSTTCEPMYRDILIFKKNGIVTGISKLCFQCGEHYMIGAKRNTEMFGQNGEFQRLENLFKK